MPARGPYSLDKLVTGGTGQVIGRTSSVTWPTRLQAQAITEGPNIGSAKFTIRRVDGDVFDFMGFTAKPLANTAGTGGSIEIMPQLNGEDRLADPAAFDATGIAGNFFTYGPASTAALRGFDTYLVTLYVDFAFTNVQVNGAIIVPEPSALVLLIGTLGMLGSARLRGRGRTFGTRELRPPPPRSPTRPTPEGLHPWRARDASAVARPSRAERGS